MTLETNHYLKGYFSHRTEADVANERPAETGKRGLFAEFPSYRSDYWPVVGLHAPRDTLNPLSEITA
jgi:hypothetical protein